MNRIETIEQRFNTDQLLTGITLSRWLEILRKADWQVSPEYYHRLAWLTGFAVSSSVLGRLEDALYARRVAAQPLDPPPFFVLGHWRTGTTHLQNVLAQDPGMTAPTVYQMVFTSHFLLTGKVGPAALKWALTGTRSYDNVRHHWHATAEDEIALAKLTGLSLYAGMPFPDALPKFEKYIDFIEATEEERERFLHAMEWLTRKIMVDSGGKRVVIKSCPHTARLRMLVDRFPHSPFLFIQRNPYETFASFMRMRRIVDWENWMQKPEQGFYDQLREQTAELGARLFTRFLEDRALIPPERYHELRYEDFVGHELEHLKVVYEKFGFSDWERFERHARPYLAGLQGYRTNALQIDQDLKDFVYDRWRMVFDAFGYSKEYPS